MEQGVTARYPESNGSGCYACDPEERAGGDSSEWRPFSLLLCEHCHARRRRALRCSGCGHVCRLPVELVCSNIAERFKLGVDKIGPEAGTRQNRTVRSDVMISPETGRA